MNEKQILEFCKTHNITVKQYFIVYATSRRWKGFVKEAESFNKTEPWSNEEIIDLIKKGMLKSSDGSYHYQSLSVNSEFSLENLNNYEWGEELWQNYPPTFPLGGGGSFIARTTKGQSKEVILKDYLTRIGNSEEKHKSILKLLPRYTRLVSTGKINGHTIADFVAGELWDTIASISDEHDLSNKFKTDI